MWLLPQFHFLSFVVNRGAGESGGLALMNYDDVLTALALFSGSFALSFLLVKSVRAIAGM